MILETGVLHGEVWSVEPGGRFQPFQPFQTTTQQLTLPPYLGVLLEERLVPAQPRLHHLQLVPGYTDVALRVTQLLV